MARRPVDLAEKFSLFSEHWSPKVVARLNDYEIKVVKVQGEFVWHTHEARTRLTLLVMRHVELRRVVARQLGERRTRGSADLTRRARHGVRAGRPSAP